MVTVYARFVPVPMEAAALQVACIKPIACQVPGVSSVGELSIPGEAAVRHRPSPGFPNGWGR